MTKNQLDLTVSGHIRAPRALVWRAWADPKHLTEWWCPKPWVTEVKKFDLRAGGAFHTLMRGPDGTESDNPGLFLEVVPETRIVCTSQLIEGWRPAKAWLPMTAIFSMEDTEGGTFYSATALHGDRETADKHREMGFYDGWGTCLKQITAYVEAWT